MLINDFDISMVLDNNLITAAPKLPYTDYALG